MIGFTVFERSGQILWNTNETQNKVRNKLSSNADFGTYMKLWRFKDFASVVPNIMEDLTLTEQGDDWWQFKSRVQLFNKNQRYHTYTSHILVFDDSMSAYIPR